MFTVLSNCNANCTYVGESIVRTGRCQRAPFTESTADGVTVYSESTRSLYGVTVYYVSDWGRSDLTYGPHYTKHMLLGEPRETPVKERGGGGGA